MKKTIIFILFISFFSFKILDVFTDLGISKTQAENNILNSLTSSYIQIPTKAGSIVSAARINVIKSIGAFAKEYCKSENFKNHYAEWWEAVEPIKPETPAEKIAREKQVADKNTAENEKSIVDLQANFKKMIAETKDLELKKQYEDALKAAMETMASTKKMLESPEYQQQMKQVQDLVQAEYLKEYEEKLAKYKLDYANWQINKNPNILIKIRLNQFLEIANSVDFNAQLKTENNLKVFIKEEYQKKDGQWKQCFRAGKQTVETAKQIAIEWLKEI